MAVPSLIPPIQRIPSADQNPRPILPSSSPELGLIHGLKELNTLPKEQCKCAISIFKYNVNIRTGNLRLLFITTVNISMEILEHTCELVIKHTTATFHTNQIINHYK